MSPWLYALLPGRSGLRATGQEPRFVTRRRRSVTPSPVERSRSFSRAAKRKSFLSNKGARRTPAQVCQAKRSYHSPFSAHVGQNARVFHKHSVFFCFSFSNCAIRQVGVGTSLMLALLFFRGDRQVLFDTKSNADLRFPFLLAQIRDSSGEELC